MNNNTQLKPRANYSIIVARSENNAIGYKGALPWTCPEDMQHFKDVTTGHICLTGYKTYLTLPKNGLPNRKLYVLTRKNLQSTSAVIFIETLQDFLKLEFSENSEVFCIGGLTIYESFLPYVSKIYLTEIKGTFQGDVFFNNNLLLGFEPKLIKETKACSYFLYTRT